MAKYQDAQGNIMEVSSPELNPDLIAGKTLVVDTPPAAPTDATGIDPASGLPYRNPNADMFNPGATPTPTATPTTPPAPAGTPAVPEAPADPNTPGAQSQGGGGTSGSAPQGGAAAPKMPQNSNQSYVVKPGDTINAIARRLGVDPTQITGYRSGNPNRIAVGETLSVGSAANTPVSTVTPPMTQNKTAQTGTPNMPTTPTGRTPLQNVMDTYTQVYKDLGLGELKTRYTSVLKEQDEIQQELNDKISDLNNNPWLSSTSREQQIDKLKDKYTPRLNLAINKAKLFDALLQEGNQTAQFLVGHIETDTNKAIELAQKKQEALDKLKEADYQIAEVNGNRVMVNKNNPKDIIVLGKAMGTDDGSGGSSGDLDKLLTVTEATALGVPYGTTRGQAMGTQPVKTDKVEDSKKNILGYLQEYSDLLGSTSAIEMKFNPSVASEANSLKSLITAEYKQMKTLGTLDAGVQKLIDGLLGSGGVAAFSNAAQKASVDKLIISLQNEAAGSGGSTTKAPAASTTYTLKGKVYVQGADGKYYPQ